MASSDSDNLPSDPSCPRCFTAAEWRRIVADVRLSPKQSQIAGYLMQSKSRHEIQRILGMRPSTFRTHYDRARAKLLAEDTPGMFVRLFEVFRELFCPKA